MIGFIDSVHKSIRRKEVTIHAKIIHDHLWNNLDEINKIPGKPSFTTCIYSAAFSSLLWFSSISSSSNSWSLSHRPRVCVCQVGTYSTETLARASAGLPRVLQSEGYKTACYKKNCELIFDTSHLGPYEAADRVCCVDRGLYRKGCRPTQRKGICFHSSRWYVATCTCL